MVEPMRGGEGNKGATFYAREVNRRGESTRLCGIRTRLCARWWRETERGGERERESPPCGTLETRVCSPPLATYARWPTYKEAGLSGAQFDEFLKQDVGMPRMDGRIHAKVRAWLKIRHGDGAGATSHCRRPHNRCHYTIHLESHENSGPRVWWGVTVPWIFLSAIQFSLRGSFLLPANKKNLLARDRPWDRIG